MKCLVLWKGYRKEEASWVKETEVTEAALRYKSHLLYLFDVM